MGQVIGTKTYYTDIETSHYVSNGGLNYLGAAPWYSKAANIKSVNFQDKIVPVSTSSWFAGCNNASFTSITNISNLDTSKVIDMSYMFAYCGAFTSLDLSTFDTNNVKSMRYMFGDCTALQGVDMSTFDTSKVESMAYMFCRCYNLKSLDLSNFNTSNVKYMDEMFDGTCSGNSTGTANIGYAKDAATAAKFNAATDTSKLKFSVAYAVYDSLDHSLKFFRSTDSYTNGQVDGTKTYYTDIETSHYTTDDQVPWYSQINYIKSVNSQDKIRPISTAYWFCNCDNTAFTSITNIGNLDTGKVTDMSDMFFNCSRLTSLDLSSFDTSKVKNMKYMFRDCVGLTNLDLSSFDISSDTNMYDMFRGVNGNWAGDGIVGVGYAKDADTAAIFNTAAKTGISTESFTFTIKP